jgi:hypothetical protein
MIAEVGSFSTKLKHWFKRPVPPVCLLGGVPPKIMGPWHGLNDSTAQKDCWNSIGRVHPLPIKIEEVEEG